MSLGHGTDSPRRALRAALGATVLERSLALPQLDGIGRYTAELWRHLGDLPGVTAQPCAFGSAGGMLDIGGFKPQALFSVATGAPFTTCHRRLSGRFDVFHATDHLIPKLRQIPVVATLHDAIPLSRPEWVSYPFKRIKNALWRKSAHWADRVITVSHHSKGEISQWFHVPAERITVTPLGVDARWGRQAARAELERVRMRHELPRHFFLFVGTLQPRKNIGRLIEAHRLLPGRLRRETPLVVAGRAGWMCEAEVAALRDGDGGTMRYLDHVPEEDLVPLLQQSSAFVLPSLHEGFGLPILEAFAAGVPVVSTTAGAIPEVAADAALLVDALDSHALADAMRRCREDGNLARTLQERGRERAAEFTWRRTAELTAEVYRRAIEQR
jgi:alpha-1,3-rhamnosyl/mannosyltransferase